MKDTNAFVENFTTLLRTLERLQKVHTHEQILRRCVRCCDLLYEIDSVDSDIKAATTELEHMLVLLKDLPNSTIKEILIKSGFIAVTPPQLRKSFLYSRQVEETHNDLYSCLIVFEAMPQVLDIHALGTISLEDVLVQINDQNSTPHFRFNDCILGCGATEEQAWEHAISRLQHLQNIFTVQSSYAVAY